MNDISKEETEALEGEQLIGETSSDEKKNYLVKSTHGEDFIIQLKANWKLTFAAVNPASAQSYSKGFCLRVYEGQKLRAVYANVEGFRDLSIPLVRKVSKETGNASWTRDDAGNFEQHTKVDVDSELILESGDDPFD